MSNTVDQERRKQAQEDRNRREELVLRELLQVVLLRREQPRPSTPTIAVRIGRSERTVRRRLALLQKLLSRVGFRRAESRG